jgi:hypothetical protein
MIELRSRPDGRGAPVGRALICESIGLRSGRSEGPGIATVDKALICKITELRSGKPDDTPVSGTALIGKASI